LNLFQAVPDNPKTKLQELPLPDIQDTIIAPDIGYEGLSTFNWTLRK
jgi:hypothetical protein